MYASLLDLSLGQYQPPARPGSLAHGYGNRHWSPEMLEGQGAAASKSQLKSGLSATALIGARTSTATGLAPASPFSAWQLLQILCFGTNSLRVLCWEPARPPLTNASIRGPQIQTAQHRGLEHLCSSGDSGLLKDLILDCFQYDHSPFKEKSKTNLRASNDYFVFSSAPFILA